jgi:stromal membrane-associated protein
MSRRPPNPAAERAAQNQVTIKSLLKLDTNKICADCKKNKHPRWASWNLGVFICIRCSGIHRGMGTHISRVKSVDLDSWTDEQLASILSWGNARANKYWENKLANGHVPSEAKIENFIRTKYELKRWVMEGPMPDPASLNVDGDDDIPLSIVKEKQQIERKESIRKASVGHAAAPNNIQGDLIGGDDLPPRASTAGPSAVAQAPPPKAAPAPAKATTAKDSLFDLDFLGNTPAAPPRPASTTGTAAMGGQSRPDLKQSILSLYASAPRPQAQPQHGHNPSGSFGSWGSMASPVQSPTMGHHAQNSASSNLAGDFAGLSFGSNSMASPKSPPKDAFAGLTSFGSGKKSTPQSASTMGGLGAGSFFDSKPAKPATPQAMSPMSPSNSFGGWGAPAPAPAKPAQPASSAMGDLFDLSSPAPAPTSLPTKAPSPPASAMAPAMGSVFNLSAPKPTSPPATAANPMGNFSNSDVWGNAWGEPAAPAAVPAPAVKSPALSQPSAFGGNDFGAWGSTGGSLASQSIVPGQSGTLSVTPAVAPDEEFGGWASSTGGGAANSNQTAKPQGGFGGGGEDLFSNVWQ